MCLTFKEVNGFALEYCVSQFKDSPHAWRYNLEAVSETISQLVHIVEEICG